MVKRLKLARQKGCLGVDPDNVDGFQADGGTGFPCTQAHQADFLRYLAQQAHALDLAVGLKNAQVGARWV